MDGEPGVKVHGCILGFIIMAGLGGCSRIYTVNDFLADSYFVPDSALVCFCSEKELRAYDIRNGQRVADIGYAYGHLLGAMVLCRDSMRLYGVEVYRYAVRYGDTLLRRLHELRKGTDPTSWTLLKGTQKRCPLPDGSLERIIIRKVVLALCVALSFDALSCSES